MLDELMMFRLLRLFPSLSKLRPYYSWVFRRRLRPM